MNTWPNFFIAGAAKAGTSSLYHYVGQHPQIYMSPVKEPTYFAAEDLLSGPLRERTLQELAKQRETLRAYLAGPMSERKWLLVLDRDDYLALFRNVQGESIIGEASVGYFWFPGAPAAIRRQVPAARLIFVLRDPAEVMFSQYLAGLAYYPPQSFRSRFLAALDPADAWRGMVESPRYATNLSRFLEYFPREQIRVYLHEDYRTNPAAVLRDIFRFLEADPDVTIDFSRRLNEPVLPRYPRLHALRRRFPRISPLRFLPGRLQTVLRNAYHRPRSDMRMEPADRRLVIAHYREEILRTGELIGRDLSAWLR